MLAVFIEDSCIGLRPPWLHYDFVNEAETRTNITIERQPFSVASLGVSNALGRELTETRVYTIVEPR